MKTPIAQQYAAIKKQYPDALLCFRVGAAFHFIEDDAKAAAAELGLPVEKTETLGAGLWLACAVPYDEGERAIAKLIAAGYKVAVCEQIS